MDSTDWLIGGYDEGEFTYHSFQPLGQEENYRAEDFLNWENSSPCNTTTTLNDFLMGPYETDHNPIDQSGFFENISGTNFEFAEAPTNGLEGLDYAPQPYQAADSCSGQVNSSTNLPQDYSNEQSPQEQVQLTESPIPTHDPNQSSHPRPQLQNTNLPTRPRKSNRGTRSSNTQTRRQPQPKQSNSTRKHRVSKPKPRRANVERVSCTWLNCNKSYHNRWSMERHIQFNHLKVRNWICQECGKTFQETTKLRDHVRRIGHTDDRY